MKLIALIISLISFNAFACHQPVCRSVQVCDHRMKHPTCHQELRCEGGTCGEKGMFSKFTLPEDVSSELISLNVQKSFFDLRAYISERQSPKYFFHINIEGFTLVEEMFNNLLGQNFPSMFVAQGSSFILLRGTVTCHSEENACEVTSQL